MFESRAEGEVAPLANAELRELLSFLRDGAPGPDDAARVERIRLLEEIKAASAAAQAVEVAAFVRSRRDVAAAEIAAVPRPGVGTRRRLAEAERGIVSDVAVARRQSPSQASLFMAFAVSAPTELPQSFGLLATGQLSERRMLSLHRATVWLTAEQRQAVDTEVAPDLSGWGDLRVEREAAAAAYRADPRGACERAAKAEAERAVSLRPAPESMTRLSALLPLSGGVATWAALDRAAGAAAAAGDERSRGQVMADTLVELVTGQTTATAVPVAVKLIITDRTLQGGSDEPARVAGYGWLPAGMARDLVLGAPGSCDGADGGADGGAARSVQRLFTDPVGRLVAMEAEARCFTAAMADFLRLRDDSCRTPWCDAPIRHSDHIDPASHGGPTTVGNGRGLCARCNLARQADGASSAVFHDAGGGHVVVDITPAGQVTRSRPPDPPRARPLHQPPVFDVVWPPAA